MLVSWAHPWSAGRISSINIVVSFGLCRPGFNVTMEAVGLSRAESLLITIPWSATLPGGSESVPRLTFTEQRRNEGWGRRIRAHLGRQSLYSVCLSGCLQSHRAAMEREYDLMRQEEEHRPCDLRASRRPGESSITFLDGHQCGHRGCTSMTSPDDESKRSPIVVEGHLRQGDLSTFEDELKAAVRCGLEVIQLSRWAPKGGSDGAFWTSLDPGASKIPEQET